MERKMARETENRARGDAALRMFVMVTHSPAPYSLLPAD